MTLPSPETPSHGSEPPSGVRRCDHDSLDVFAADVLRDRRRWSRVLGLPRCDVEDVMHDALVLLMERRDAIEPPARWSWFASAVRNGKLGLMRDQARACAHEAALVAHFAAQPPPFPPPDAEIPDRAAVTRWLVAQVHPTRRDVAERHLCDQRTLEKIAADTSIPLGTVRSRWTRAKADMRAALDREQAKRGRMAWLAALVVLLSTVWAWLKTTTNGPDAATDASARGRRRAVLLAAVVVALAAVATHEQRQAVELVGDDVVACGFEVERAILPFLSSPAEREREWALGASRAAGAPGPIDEREREMARGFLTVATSALQRGDVATARDALHTYDLTCADNPFSQQRAALGASLAALDARSRRGLP